MSDLNAATWRKSTRSGGGNACVEVALTSRAAGIRDTKDRDGGFLAMGPAVFDAFRAAITTRH